MIRVSIDLLPRGDARHPHNLRTVEIVNVTPPGDGAPAILTYGCRSLNADGCLFAEATFQVSNRARTPETLVAFALEKLGGRA